MLAVRNPHLRHPAQPPGYATLLPRHEIHRCFERVNQLLSLLVPVSDINRVAVGGGAGRLCQQAEYYPLREFQALSAGIYPNLPDPKHANGEV